MDRFDWDGLRVDTAVVVHVGPDLRLVEGRVRSVSARRRGNLVGVRLADGAVAWPVAAEVHLLPRDDDTDRCWRCAFRRSTPSWSAAAIAPGALPV